MSRSYLLAELPLSFLVGAHGSVYAYSLWLICRYRLAAGIAASSTTTVPAASSLTSNRPGSSTTGTIPSSAASSQAATGNGNNGGAGPRFTAKFGILGLAGLCAASVILA